VKRNVLLAATVPLLVIAVSMLPWLNWWDQLPDQMATHWDLLGRANGSNSRIVALVTSMTLASVVVIGWCGYAVRRLLRRSEPASSEDADFWFAALGFSGGVLAAISVGTVWVNGNASSWRKVDLPLW
jgi:hypothetical protein